MRTQVDFRQDSLIARFKDPAKRSSRLRYLQSCRSNTAWTSGRCLCSGRLVKWVLFSESVCFSCRGVHSLPDRSVPVCTLLFLRLKRSYVEGCTSSREMQQGFFLYTNKIQSSDKTAITWNTVVAYKCTWIITIIWYLLTLFVSILKHSFGAGRPTWTLEPQGLTGAHLLYSSLLNVKGPLYASALFPERRPFTTSLFSAHSFQNPSHVAVVTDGRKRQVLVMEELDLSFAFTSPVDLEQSQVWVSGSRCRGWSEDRTGTVAGRAVGLRGEGGDPSGCCWDDRNVLTSWKMRWKTDMRM